MHVPAYVEITDVGLRDGIQNVNDVIPTDTKAALARKIMDTGVSSMELVSFVSPKWIPQMADAAELIRKVKPWAEKRNIKMIGLVPNLKGMERAVESGLNGVTYVVSVSEKHNLNNVNRTTWESFQQMDELKSIQPTGMTFCLALATAFGCPFGEEITAEKVVNAVKVGIDNGADEIILADTIGTANPVLIEKITGAVLRIVPAGKIKLHLHDTMGMALANTVTAMQMGIYRFEASAGGLGGCPYAPGASGNSATEDLNGMLTSMGVKTGISQEKLIDAVKYIKENIPSRINSHVWSKKQGSCKDG